MPIAGSTLGFVMRFDKLLRSLVETDLAKNRNLNIILNNARKGDLLIVSELSRLGRSTPDVLNTCQTLIKNGTNCYFVKQNMSLDNSPMGKMMTAILAAFAEMERDLISQRTIEGQIRARQNGIKIGRPKGVASRKLKASYEYIRQCLDIGLNKSQIARRCNCSWNTMHRFMKENNFITWDGHHQKSLDNYEENKKHNEEIELIRKKDTERTNDYLTLQDFRKLYGN
jgi:DNA invertase Pin-like site-specific DNA recombinase